METPTNHLDDGARPGEILPASQRPGAPELSSAMQVLAWLAENPALGGLETDLGRGVARAYKRVRKQRRIDAAHAARQTKPSIDSSALRTCYICRSTFQRVDAMYPMLCPECADANRAHRNRRADLSGRRALVTGGRIKLGYQTVLKLLRDGAEVIATSRFPCEAAGRYAKEPDFSQWRHRLKLRRIDFRDLRGVQQFADELAASLDGLDILVNNAAQTIRPSDAFHRSLLARENNPPAELREEIQSLLMITAPDAGTAIDLPGWQPPGELVTKPEMPVASSWTLSMEQVDPAELAEVMVINAMAPFILCARLEPLMRRSRFADRYIVNVTSIEGQFERDYKAADHPHTNMAKAALNMLTRTAAKRCAESGIYMNSVDPGWITHMIAVDPSDANDGAPGRASPVPLDAIDGAARIYDPILRGINGSPVSGLLLKDFAEVAW
ncbi:MAG TPA: SDR family NAD(P)-dependent oxidoreductase [Tepidisphaeraceae bacterium]|jgi:NAD(P)-dependent dehydrogenase (short-subunit alcohol dehydrogenase family)|nr:SDR family NAD(P)-dependent oxidoreductase [Tepidisphaeraceae bacterium]